MTSSYDDTAPAIRQARAAADTAADAFGTSRRNQLHWVVGELERALRHADFPTVDERWLASVLAPEPVAAYFRLAATGELRASLKRRPATDPRASERVRRRCLELIAGVMSIPIHLPDAPSAPPTHPPISDTQRRALWDTVAHPPLPYRRESRWRVIRSAAALGLVLDVGAHEGDLVRLRVTDLSADLDLVDLVHRPDRWHQTRTGPPSGRYRLSSAGSAAIRRWLDTRSHIVADMQRPGPALWVATVPTARGPRDQITVCPAGMPLTAEILREGIADLIRTANADHAGEPGWTPIPVRLEQIRRAVIAEPVTRLTAQAA